MHIRLSTRSTTLAMCLILCTGSTALAAGKRPKNQRNLVRLGQSSRCSKTGSRSNSE